MGNRRQIYRWLVLAGTLTALILLFIFVRPVITPFLMAVAIAYLFAPWIEKMRCNGTPVWLGLSVLVCYTLALLYFLLILTLPVILEQLRNLLEYIPDFLQNMEEVVSGFMASFPDNQLTEKISASLMGFGERAEAWIFDAGAGMIDMASGLPELVLELVLAPIAAYYFLRDKKNIGNAALSLVHPAGQPEARRLAGELDGLVRSFVSGYLLVSLIVAAISVVFYYAIGVDYALVLGILMGIADMIPYFGPIIGAVPAVLLALAESRAKALVVIVGLVILQQVESSVITPRVMGDRVGLHPLVTIFSVLAGGYLWGLAGAIISVPLAAVILLLSKYMFSRVFSNNELRNQL